MTHLYFWTKVLRQKSLPTEKKFGGSVALSLNPLSHHWFYFCTLTLDQIGSVFWFPSANPSVSCAHILWFESYHTYKSTAQ